MDHGRVVKKTLNSKLNGRRRRMGRPRMRRLEYVEKICRRRRLKAGDKRQ